MAAACSPTRWPSAGLQASRPSGELAGALGLVIAVLVILGLYRLAIGGMTTLGTGIPHRP